MSMNNYVTMAAGQSGSASFTTALNVLHYDMASVHATWSGAVAGTLANIRVYGSNNNATWFPLDTDPTTMVASQGSNLWNIWSLPYHWLQVAYEAKSNTTGSINVDVAIKARQ
jgi:hypothetical protein